MNWSHALLAEALDVHRAADAKCSMRAGQLRRAVDVGAERVALALGAHERAAADRALVGNFHSGRPFGRSASTGPTPRG